MSEHSGVGSFGDSPCRLGFAGSLPGQVPAHKFWVFSVGTCAIATAPVVTVASPGCWFSVGRGPVVGSGQNGFFGFRQLHRPTPTPVQRPVSVRRWRGLVTPLTAEPPPSVSLPLHGHRTPFSSALRPIPSPLCVPSYNPNPRIVATGPFPWSKWHPCDAASNGNPGGSRMRTPKRVGGHSRRDPPPPATAGFPSARRSLRGSHPVAGG